MRFVSMGRVASSVGLAGLVPCVLRDILSSGSSPAWAGCHRRLSMRLVSMQRHCVACLPRLHGPLRLEWRAAKWQLCSALLAACVPIASCCGFRCASLCPELRAPGAPSELRPAGAPAESRSGGGCGCPCSDRRVAWSPTELRLGCRCGSLGSEVRMARALSETRCCCACGSLGSDWRPE